MIITNFKNLTKNPFREKALLIAEAGYEAIDIERVVLRRIKLKKQILEIEYPLACENAKIRERMKQKIKKINLNNFKRVFIVGVGKGSILATAALSRIMTPLGSQLVGGIALDVKFPISNFQFLNKSQISDSKFIFIQGTHPLPSKQNIIATQKIIKLVKNLKKDDLLINFICGGGSALLCDSKKEMKNLILATKLLTQVGVDILEVNTIRKHLSNIKGGGLAKLAYPATTISLIVSDVLGNDLSIVASGPTVFDKTTRKDAERAIKKYLRKFALQSALIRVLAETPKNIKYFKKVKNILFLSNCEPIFAMLKKAKELGLKAKIHSLFLKGEAENVLLPIIKKIKSNEAMIAGGETTVNLKNSGKGGRNMESVLGALVNSLNSKFYILNSKIVIMSFASDSRDNTEAAGAIADFLTIKKAQNLKLNPREFLDENQSFSFFEKTKDLIFAEQKYFNVADLMIVLKISNFKSKK